ncbi:MAG: hypothetical protein ACRDTM_11880, partial [Micromonosporaceae bacterium]
MPAALRVGRRRAVGPLIGAELAGQLLEEHQPDVLVAERCACGGAFPCRSRLFAAGFATEEARPAVLAGTAYPPVAQPPTPAAQRSATSESAIGRR